MLHSVGKSGTLASELTVLGNIEDGNRIHITSDSEVVEGAKRDASGHDTASECGIMDDSS